jgi:hypothetical protein
MEMLFGCGAIQIPRVACKDCGAKMLVTQLGEEYSHALNCPRFMKAKQQRYFGIIPYVPKPETEL